MKPWEFVINTPEDLGPFSDLLEEWGHPGVVIVRALIRDKKFPKSIIKTNGGNQKTQIVWIWRRWFWIAPKDSDVIPLRFWELSTGELTYFTAMEAVWAIINTGKYT